MWSHSSGEVVNLFDSGVDYSFRCYKKYKNLPRNMSVMVQNKVSHSFWPTVYLCPVVFLFLCRPTVSAKNCKDIMFSAFVHLFTHTDTTLFHHKCGSRKKHT